MNSNVNWLAASTVGQILSRAGLTQPKEEETARHSQLATVLDGYSAQSALVHGFHGYFLTGDGCRCDPFTITDVQSRFLIRCQAVAHMNLAQLSAVAFPRCANKACRNAFAQTTALSLRASACWVCRSCRSDE
jgi:hypothetical protein